MEKRASSAAAWARRVTRLLDWGDGERYAFRPHLLGALDQLVEGASRGPGAVDNIGALLKVAYVLRRKHASPAAADVLLGALTQCPEARRIVLTRWTAGSRRARYGSDLSPVRLELAPRADAARPAGAVPLATLWAPSMDLRARHLRSKTKEKK